MEKINISNALFSKGQQVILGLLYSQPETDFYTNEIIRLTKTGTGATQRELTRLTKAGLISVRTVGNQKHYQADISNPIFTELRSIVLKTFGLADIIRDALKPVSNKIQFAFIYGSVAKQEDHAKSDIDLMIISEELTYSELFSLLEKTENTLRRKINPTFYSQKEWTKKYKQRNNFIIQVEQNPKIFLIGNEDEFNSVRKSS